MKKEQQRNAAAVTGRPCGSNPLLQSTEREMLRDAQHDKESRRQPYEAPAVEVIEVQTERGYAGSLDQWDGDRW